MADIQSVAAEIRRGKKDRRRRKKPQGKNIMAGHKNICTIEKSETVWTNAS